jgi:hypothetical protein
MHWKSLFTSQENENFKKAAVEGEQIPFKEVDVNAPTQMKWLGTHWDPTPIPPLHMWPDRGVNPERVPGYWVKPGNRLRVPGF